MNSKRKIKLHECRMHLQSAEQILNDVYEEESNAVQNYPENLQMTDRYFQLEDNCNNLEEALDYIRSASEKIDQVMN